MLITANLVTRPLFGRQDRHAINAAEEPTELGRYDRRAIATSVMFTIVRSMSTSAGPLRKLATLPAILVIAGLLSSCGLFSTCPTSVDAALSGGVPGETEATLIAVARVIRFVPSPTLSHRGYDLALRRVLVGDPVESVIGLRVPNEIAGIRRLSPVLVLAEIGGTEPQLLTPGRCQPLQAISEAEFIRWAER